MVDRNGFRFEERRESWFVGVGGSGPFFDTPEDNWVVPLWEELFAHENELPPTGRGSGYVSPCHARESEFTFYGGVLLQERPPEVPDGMRSFRIPAHRYAVGTVSGSSEAVAATYGALGEWVREQGGSVNSAILWLEVYPEKPVLHPGGPFDYEIWLPVV